MTINKKDVVNEKTKVFDAEKVKCSSCNQALASSSRRIEGHRDVLCEACYQNTVFPHTTSSYELMLNRY